MRKRLGSLRIKDRQFDVKDATLSGRVNASGPIHWSINVETHGASFSRELWEPRAYIEQYRSSARSMDEFLGSPIVIKSGSDSGRQPILPGSSVACLYVFEHDYTNENSIHLTGNSENGLNMVWQAKCVVHWGKKYGEGLDLHIGTELEFLGFSVDAQDTVLAGGVFARSFQTDGFHLHLEPGHQGYFFLPIPGAW